MLYSRSVNDGTKRANRASKRYNFPQQRITGDEVMNEDYQSDTFYTQLPSSPTSSASSYHNSQLYQGESPPHHTTYSSIRDDCSMTSCIVSLCLCMNFAAIVATVTLCLIFLGSLDMKITLDRNMYSRMVVFPTWKHFAHSVRFHKLQKSKQDFNEIQWRDNYSYELEEYSDENFQKLNTETIIYSLKDDPVVDPDAFHRIAYGPVHLTALTSSSMDFEYWKFALNKESIIQVKSFVEYVGVKDKRTDVMKLDIVVGSDEFGSWQNQNRGVAYLSIPLTSGIHQKFLFKLTKQHHQDNSSSHTLLDYDKEDEDDGERSRVVYTSIPIDYSTETVYFIFNYADKPHKIATKAVADFTVTYSNLMPSNSSQNDGTVINQCQLDEGECRFSKDSFPPHVLIRTNPNNFENDSFHFDYSVGLNMAKAMPLSLSPLMGAVLFDIVYIFSFVFMYLCCGLKSCFRFSRGDAEDEYSGLLDNE